MSAKGLPRTVIMLGLVSLFTDVSSEMIYPLLPVFLAEVLGATAMSLGLIEGVAEATASLFKVYSGLLVDKARQKKGLIAVGYSISSLARPLIGLVGSWGGVLGLRFIDRIGKGIRSSPRDALIASVTPENQRGQAYGLHRAMDHAGSVAGPLVAAGLMTYAGFEMRSVFLFAAVPAAIAMLIIFFGVKEDKDQSPSKSAAPKERLSLRRDFKVLNPELKRLLGLYLLFTLGNSTDAFLLLKLTSSGVTKSQIVLLWSAFHVVKMTASWFGGRLSDKVGHRRMILVGWGFYAVVYGAFAYLESEAALVALFLAYGLYFGLTEPSEKALVAEFAPPEHRGKAFGFFHFTVGIGALPASLLFGWLWTSFGSSAAFLAGAGLAFAATIGLASLHGTPKTTI